LAAGLVVLALVLGACGGDSSPSATPTPAPPDPAVLAQEAATAVAGLKSFHFVFEHENGTSPVAFDLDMKRAEGDMAPPDRLRADVDAVATRLAKVNVSVQVVIVGDEAQVTNPFNRSQWLPLPGADPLGEIFDPSRGVAGVLQEAKNLQIVDEEEVDGAPSWKLQGDLDSAALAPLMPFVEPGRPVTVLVWIGQSDRLARRIWVQGPLREEDEDDIVRKVELSRFNEPVTITAP
jgi:hypothetical protein